MPITRPIRRWPKAQNTTLSGATAITADTIIQMGDSNLAGVPYTPATISTNRVTLSVFPNAVQVTFLATATSPSILDITGSNVTIDGTDGTGYIHVNNQSGYSGVFGIDVESSAASCRITDISVSNGGANAVGIALNATNAMVEASTINAVIGIQVLDSITATIQTNTISNGTIGIDVEGPGNATLRANNNIITGNAGTLSAVQH